MPIRCELDAGGDPAAEIVHQRKRVTGIASAERPREDQFRVGIECGPRPNVTSAFRRAFRSCYILLLRIAESPPLIALDALTPHAAHCLIREPRAYRADSR